MMMAIEEAKLSLSEDELPVGAIIAVDGKIYGKGRRMVHGNTRLEHAEIRTLREALALDKERKLDGKMTIYTTLEPCMMCFGTILHSKIGRVVYALEDPYGGATHLKSEHLPLRHRTRLPEITGGVMRKEVKGLFRGYFKNTKNKFWITHRENPLVKVCDA